MRNLVEGFLRVNQYDVNFVTICESRNCFLDCYNELCLARAFLPETILIVFENVVSFKMGHHIAMNDVFKKLAGKGHQGYWSVVCPFLNTGTTQASFHLVGISPQFSDVW